MTYSTVLLGLLDLHFEHFDTPQNFSKYFTLDRRNICRCQWPRGLKRRPPAACLQRSWFRIPPGAWMFVCCECRVLSGRGLCDELITRPEESYRLWCVVACDLEISRIRVIWPALGRSATNKKQRRNVAKCVNLHQRSLSSMPSVRGNIFEWSTTGSLFVNIRLLSFLTLKSLN